LCVAVAQIFQVTNFAQSQRKEKAAQVKKRDNPLSTLCIAIKEQEKKNKTHTIVYPRKKAKGDWQKQTGLGDSWSRQHVYLQ
jgi:hypothetical protein